jgi:hypothetical protein
VDRRLILIVVVWTTADSVIEFDNLSVTTVR